MESWQGLLIGMKIRVSTSREEKKTEEQLVSVWSVPRFCFGQKKGRSRWLWSLMKEEWWFAENENEKKWAINRAYDLRLAEEKDELRVMVIIQATHPRNKGECWCWGCWSLRERQGSSHGESRCSASSQTDNHLEEERHAWEEDCAVSRGVWAEKEGVRGCLKPWETALDVGRRHHTLGERNGLQDYGQLRGGRKIFA